MQRIVRDVLETLHTPTAKTRPAAAASPSESLVSTPTISNGGSLLSASPSASLTSSASSESSVLALGERVVTGAVLEERHTTQTKIAVDPKAVLTPSAREYLKRHRIELIRGTSASAGEKAAQRAGTVEASSSAPRWRIFVVQSHPHLERLIEESNRITTAQWDRILPGTMTEAVGVAIAAVARAEIAGGVILTHQPLVAACHANRQADVRAAPVRDAADIRQARQHLAANLFALDPDSKSYFELRNLLKLMTSP